MKKLPGVQRVKARVWNTQGRVDGRKSAKISGARKAAAGRRGRGQDIHSGVKSDPELEARIELVVKAALSGQHQAKASAIGCEDVVLGEQFIRLNGLKASRVG